MFKYLLSLVILSLFFNLSCNKKSKKDINIVKNIKKNEKKLDSKTLKRGISIDLTMDKGIKNGDLNFINVKVNNGIDEPIIILSIKPNFPRVTKKIIGTKYLKTKKHKFVEGDYIEYLKTDQDGTYTIPEFHKIDQIIYPKQFKKYKIKGVIQTLSSDYKNNISLSYIPYNKKLEKYIYCKRGIKGDIIRYTPMIKGDNLENCLIKSSILGKAKTFKKGIKYKLSPISYNPFPNYTEIEYIYYDVTDSWIFCNNVESVIVPKNGKKMVIKGTNLARLFTKAKFSKEVTIKLPKNSLKNMKDILSKYSFTSKHPTILKFKIPSSELMDLFLKLYKKGFNIHKSGMIYKI